MEITLISLYSNITAYGLRILSSGLKHNGNKVKIIFLQGNFWETYPETVLKELVELCRGSDHIGISVMTNFLNNAILITKRLKPLGIPITWGGIHPTMCPNESLGHANMVCIGDPILAFELDSYPFPDYYYRDHYIQYNGHLKRMTKQLLKKHLGKTYLTLATRGCKHSCTYCCNNRLNKMFPGQQKVRKRSIDNIIAELTWVKKKLPFITTIWFEDDSFFEYSEDEILDFSRKYKKHIRLALKVHGISPYNLTRTKLALLVNAGLTKVRMGIQTASKRGKELYKRNIPNSRIREAVEIINEFKDKLKVISYDIILDNPWETEKDTIETLLFLCSLPVPFSLNIFSLVFFPGTELYDKAKREGISTECRYYHQWKDTYLNRLFVLLNEYTRVGGEITPNGMKKLIKNKSSYDTYKLWIAASSKRYARWWKKQIA